MVRSKGETCKVEVSNKHVCSPECFVRLNKFENYVPRKARHKTGYIYIGRQREHTLVAERMLGCKLSKGEIVHHIDGDKGNNVEANLLVCTLKEHNRIHGQLEALAFLLLQEGTIRFCPKCRLYFKAIQGCGCGSSFSA